VREIRPEQIEERARDARHLELLRSLGLRSIMCVPLMAHGQIRGAVTFVAAESGRYFTASDLTLAEDLARRAAIAVENARLYRELQEAIRIRDEFLSSVSHDLKNPIAAVRGRAQMLQRRLDRLPPDEAERFEQGLEAIDSSVTRMVRILNDLVDVARLRIGQPLELTRYRTDIVDLVRQVAAEQAEAEGRTISVTAAPDPLIGSWDAPRLERVITNLLTNAIKYSPTGCEIAVAVREESDAGGRYAVVTVQDRGIGIPAADLPHIFDRYHRAANVVNAYPGTGVGLAGAKQIVEQHGGTIEVASRENEGSKFTVRLPLAS
jgi:signal transduction histidine kinase